MLCLYSPVNPSAVYVASSPTSEGQLVQATTGMAVAGPASKEGQWEWWRGPPSREHQPLAKMATSSLGSESGTTRAGTTATLNAGNGGSMLSDAGEGNEGNEQATPRGGGKAQTGVRRWWAVRSPKQQHAEQIEVTRARPPSSQNGSTQVPSGVDDSGGAVNGTARWEERGEGMAFVAPRKDGGGMEAEGPLLVPSPFVSTKEALTIGDRKHIRKPIVARLTKRNIDAVVSVHNKARYGVARARGVIHCT